VPGLLCFVHSLDSQDMVFSHQQQVVRELRSKFDPVTIVTRKVSNHLGDLHAETHVIEWNSNKFYSLIKFVVRSIPLVVRARRQNLILFFIQTDFYAAILCPIAKMIGVRSALWYAHKVDSIYLKIASRFVDVMFSANVESMPKLNRKVRIIGHFVDLDTFPPRTRPLENNQLRRLYYVGRCDKAKNIDNLLDAFNSLRTSWEGLELCLVGEPSTDENWDYFKALLNDHDVLQRGDVKFLGRLSRENLAELAHKSGILIHATDGSLDKVLLEATLTLNPVATCNSGYLREFGSWSSQKGSLDHVQRIVSEVEAILSMDSTELYSSLLHRREKVVGNHSLHSWANKVHSILMSESSLD
jgi:glycosyltransferase involved in cell wall biosynthesis